jgi:hypothetical protein
LHERLLIEERFMLTKRRGKGEGGRRKDEDGEDEES